MFVICMYLLGLAQGVQLGMTIGAWANSEKFK